MAHEDMPGRYIPYKDRIAPIPFVLRRRVINRAGGVCEICGGGKRLYLHHLTYENIGHETEEDLAALCADCHKAVHIDAAGVFWDDVDEMNWCWESYYHELEKE